MKIIFVCFFSVLQIVANCQEMDSSFRQKFNGFRKQTVEGIKKTSKLGLSIYANGNRGYLFLTYAMDVERDTRRKNVKMIISHSMYYQDLNQHLVNIKANMISYGAVLYFPLKRLYFAVPFEAGFFIVNSQLFGSYVIKYGGLAQTGLRIGWKFKNLNTISCSLNPTIGYGPVFSNDPNITASIKYTFGVIGIPRVSLQFKL